MLGICTCTKKLRACYILWLHFDFLFNLYLIGLLYLQVIRTFLCQLLLNQ